MIVTMASPWSVPAEMPVPSPELTEHPLTLAAFEQKSDPPPPPEPPLVNDGATTTTAVVAAPAPAAAAVVAVPCSVAGTTSSGAGRGERCAVAAIG